VQYAATLKNSNQMRKRRDASKIMAMMMPVLFTVVVVEK